MRSPQTDTVFNRLIRFGLFLTALALFSAGCASTQTTSASNTSADSSQTSTPASPGTPSVAATSASGASSAVDPSSSSDIARLMAVPEKSQARYRVREQLANVALPSDAVGSTNAITGTIVGKADGTIVSAESKFTVDLRTLKSDQSFRDNFLRRSVLETDQYPYAEFVPTSAPGLPTTVPSSGQASFKLIGNLTIRNVTKEVTWDVTCQAQGNEGTCHATTSFTFEFFNLTQPHVSRVLSIVDNITLEVDLDLQRVGA